MGKKDKINLLPRFDDVYNRVIELPEKDLEDLWRKHGKRTLTHYNLRWSWSAIEEWASLDNSHGERTFRILVDFKDFMDTKRANLFERIAVVIAGELKMELDMIY